MPAPTREITIPEVRVDPEHLLELIRRLDGNARRQIAQVLADSEMDERLGDLIRRLATGPSTDEMSDAAIDREVSAVRGSSTRTR
jgi:hypothetical protein